MELSDALCGCPSSGSTPQGSNSIGPSQNQPGGPAWPTQPGQQPTHPPSCWPGQPNTPCWPGPQPSQPDPASAQNWPGPQPQPPQPAPSHPCQSCWPGPPQFQPQPSQPQPQPQPALQPSQPPAPAPAPQVPSQPSAPRWPVTQGLNPGINPGSGWPFSPGKSGWPGQNPGLNPGGSGWPFSPGQDPGSQSGWPGQNPGGFTPAPQWTPTPAGHLNVPHNLNLQRGIYDKMMMTIMGQVKPNAKHCLQYITVLEEWAYPPDDCGLLLFTVNFLRGNDIAFHLNPRFSDGGKQAVVRNTKVGECWGKEERHTRGSFPFMAGQSFEMKILITFEEFKVAVNGAQLFEFKHRVRELNQIDRVNILHDVILTYVNVDTIP